MLSLRVRRIVLSVLTILAFTQLGAFDTCIEAFAVLFLAERVLAVASLLVSKFDRHFVSSDNYFLAHC